MKLSKSGDFMDLMKDATENVERHKRLLSFRIKIRGRRCFRDSVTQAGFVLLVSLAGFGREILFFLHPFLEATLQNSPLSTNFEGGDLAVLNHAMQRSFRNFQNSCRLS
jgi:hypothetical protein